MAVFNPEHKAVLDDLFACASESWTICPWR